MTTDGEGKDPQKPRSMWKPTPAQRELLDLMREGSDVIASRFEGALRAFADEENPECLIQSASSMREVFANFALVLRIPIPTKSIDLGKEFRDLSDEWRRALGLRPGAPLAEGQLDAVPAEALAGFLPQLHGLFIRWDAEVPRRADRREQIFKASDPQHGLMPDDLRKRRQKQFEHLESYMTRVLHHTPTTRRDFEQNLGACERLFREMLRPAPTASRLIIDEILRKG